MQLEQKPMEAEPAGDPTAVAAAVTGPLGTEFTAEGGDSMRTETGPSRKKRKAEALSGALENSRLVLAKAVKTIDTLRLEKEDTAYKLLSALSCLRAENAKLRQHCASLESNEVTTAELASRRVEDAKSSEDKASALEHELSELKIAHERLQREKLADEETLVKKIRKSADDAALVQTLRAQLTELLEYRVSAESRIAERDNTALKLVRDSESSAAESAGIAKRCAFLEDERVRLSTEVAEARSLHEIATAEHAARVKSTNALLVSLRADLISSTAKVETLNQQVSVLHGRIKDLQEQREQNRVGALDEAKRMKDIVQMHMEATEEAEARAKKYKDLLETVTSNNKELMQKRPPPRKSLDAAAEALLKDMQNTLDQKLNDLASQREEVEKARVAERTIAAKFQTLAREAEDSKRVRDQALARVAATERENAELKKRVTMLEERILLAASPHPSLRTLSKSEYGGNRTTPRMGITPPSAQREPYAAEMEADPVAFSSAMDQMRNLQQRHESVLEALAIQRGEVAATPRN